MTARFRIALLIAIVVGFPAAIILASRLDDSHRRAQEGRERARRVTEQRDAFCRRERMALDTVATGRDLRAQMVLHANTGVLELCLGIPRIPEIDTAEACWIRTAEDACYAPVVTALRQLYRSTP